MANCEMCGKESNLLDAKVEGVEMKLCQDCSKYGMVQRKNSPRKFTGSRSFSKSNTLEFELVTNYSKKLQQARNLLGQNQEEFAKSLNEKLSVVQKWESGQMKPRIETARKLERILKIKLVQAVGAGNKETNEKKDLIFSKKSNDSFTLGDFVKVRKRKK